MYIKEVIKVDRIDELLIRDDKESNFEIEKILEEKFRGLSKSDLQKLIFNTENNLHATMYYLHKYKGWRY